MNRVNQPLLVLALLNLLLSSCGKRTAPPNLPDLVSPTPSLSQGGTRLQREGRLKENFFYSFLKSDGELLSGSSQKEILQEEGKATVYLPSFQFKALQVASSEFPQFKLSSLNSLSAKFSSEVQSIPLSLNPLSKIPKDLSEEINFSFSIDFSKIPLSHLYSKKSTIEVWDENAKKAILLIQLIPSPKPEITWISKSEFDSSVEPLNDTRADSVLIGVVLVKNSNDFPIAIEGQRFYADVNGSRNSAGSNFNRQKNCTESYVNEYQIWRWNSEIAIEPLNEQTPPLLNPKKSTYFGVRVKNPTLVQHLRNYPKGLGKGFSSEVPIWKCDYIEREVTQDGFANYKVFFTQELPIFKVSANPKLSEEFKRSISFKTEKKFLL